MTDELSGIERRLDELEERLARLAPLKDKPRAEFDADPYLRDIAERNLEIAAQCIIDVSHRLIVIENARRPADYYEAILLAGELQAITPDLASRLAPLAGFRNILVHEYLGIDWDHVHRNLSRLEELAEFAAQVRSWLKRRDHPDAHDSSD